MDGSILGGPIPACDKDTGGCNTPYGSLVDAGGTLWSASLSNQFFRLNTANTADRDLYFHAGSDYGIAIGSQGGVTHVYQANYSGACSYTDFNTSTETFSLTDINAINAARNTPSAGVCDPRDADGDGVITTNDSRACTVRCTKPRCQ